MEETSNDILEWIHANYFQLTTAEKKVADFVGVSSPERIVFTPGATFSLNLAIKTGIKKGAHLLISDMEHNSVLRTVHSLKACGICDYSLFDAFNPEMSIESAVRSETTHIISTLASNVSGDFLDIKALERVAKKHRLSLILDASQRLGHAPFSLDGIEFDALCCASHKSLFGFAGAGFIAFGNDNRKESFIEGGSGSDSKSLFMPDNLPERFEGGTLPVPAIISLGAGIDFINKIELPEIEKKLLGFTERLSDILDSFKEVSFFKGNSGTLVFTHRKIPSEALASMLDAVGVCVRGGFHCAPLAHKKLGTYEDGAVRISLSCLNTYAQIDCFYKRLKDILK